MEDNTVRVRLRVYFDDPFWVGLFEKHYQGKITACKVVFGSEPRGWEIADFIDSRYQHLAFSPPVEGVFSFDPGRINPKRRQRAISQEMKRVGTSTFSQQALQIQREAGKQERRVKRTQHKAEAAHQKYMLKQLKKKEKKKGH